MKEPTTIYAVSMHGRVALNRWDVGYDLLEVGPKGVLVEWCRKGLFADAFCVMNDGDDKATVSNVTAAWCGVAGKISTPMTPELAEEFIAAVDALAEKKGLVPREGYPPFPCECGRVGEPTIAMTTLGDGTDMVGLWCRACRNRVSFAQVDDRAIPLLPPGRWLSYDRKLPECGEKWPERREDPATAFPFGANAP